MKKQPSQIITGVLSTIAFWVLCLLISGDVGVGDIIEITPGIPVVRGLLPVLAIVYASVIAFYSKRENKKALFLSVVISLAIPTVSLWIAEAGGIFSLLYVTALPATSILYGCRDVFGSRTVYDILMLCVFICPAAVYLSVKPEGKRVNN